MRFSAIDLGLELFTFLAMLAVFLLLTSLNVYGIGVSYFHTKKLFFPALMLGIGVSILPIAFLLKHLGMDPLMKWDEFQEYHGSEGNGTLVEAVGSACNVTTG